MSPTYENHEASARGEAEAGTGWLPGTLDPESSLAGDVAGAYLPAMTDPKLPARWTDDVRRGTRRGARLPTRAELRQLVAEHLMEIREVTAVGANARELRLDHQKKLLAYAANLSRDDAASFLRQYAEEMTAASGAGEVDQPLLPSPADSGSSRMRATVPIIVILAIAAVLVLLVVFRAFA